MIYITGDTHIPIDIHKLSSKKFPDQKKLTRDDFLIICGDFGGVWDGGKEEIYWQKWLNNKNFTTIFVDGNHENFDLINKLDVVEFCGAKAHRISDNIFHLMRGQIFEINGKRIFAFGGASSHDKEHRTEGVNWWKDELPSKQEFEEAIANLDRICWKADYVITHCAPSSVQRAVDSSYQTDELTDFFETIKDRLDYKKWFFGHYHRDIQVDEKHIALFDSVIPAE